MRKDLFYKRFLDAGELYAATLDGAGLVEFNKHFDPLATIAAHALNRPVKLAFQPVQLRARRLRRALDIAKAHDARRARLKSLAAASVPVS